MCHTSSRPNGPFLARRNTRRRVAPTSLSTYFAVQKYPDLAAGAFADQGERAPERGVGVARRGGIVEVSQHGLTQRLGAAEIRIGLEAIEGRGGEPRGCGRID